MPPEKFGKRRGSFSFAFDINDVFPMRPELAVPFAMSVSYWAYVESYYANLQSTLQLQSTLDDLVRFQKRRNSKREQKEVRDSASEILSPEHLPLFLEALELAVSPGAERNDLVHGIAMVVDAYPDAVLILRPEHVQKLHFHTFGRALREPDGSANLSDLGLECMSHALIYRLPELHDLCSRIKTSERLMFHLWQFSIQKDAQAMEVGRRALLGILAKQKGKPNSHRH